MNTYDTHIATRRVVPLIPSKGYLGQLRLEEERRVLELKNLRAALCEYQLKYWTLQYHNTTWFKGLLGDDDEDWSDEDGGGE